MRGRRAVAPRQLPIRDSGAFGASSEERSRNWPARTAVRLATDSSTCRKWGLTKPEATVLRSCPGLCPRQETVHSCRELGRWRAILLQTKCGHPAGSEPVATSTASLSDGFPRELAVEHAGEPSGQPSGPTMRDGTLRPSGRKDNRPQYGDMRGWRSGIRLGTASVAACKPGADAGSRCRRRLLFPEQVEIRSRLFRTPRSDVELS